MTDVTINAADGGTFTGYLAKPPAELVRVSS